MTPSDPSTQRLIPGQIGIETSRIEISAGDAMPWGLLSAHRWFIILNGKGRVEGPDGSARFSRGDLLLAPAGLRHRLCAGARPVSALLLRLRWRAFAAAQCVDRLGADILSALVVIAREDRYRPALPASIRNRAFEQIRSMAALDDASQPGCELALKARLLDLLAILLRWKRLEDHLGKAGPEPAETGGMRELLHHLEEHYADPLGVREAAAIVGLGRSRFHEAFREATGMTFATYLTRLRVSKAAELLRKTPRGVLDVAMSCGFGSTSRFYEAFGQIMGTSPARYRRGE
ncbi:MAG: helix-turn-helix domain-containing protein [Phycisphaerae bacterium]